MLVVKFGGSSLATANKIKSIYNTINSIPSKLIVVLSAAGKTTDLLVGLIKAFSSDAKGLFKISFEKLLNNHLFLIDELFSDELCKNRANAALYYHLDYINTILHSTNLTEINNEILVRGEYISTEIFYWYLKEQNEKAALLKAEKFMRIDENKEPDLDLIELNLREELNYYNEAQIFITQGFLCKNHLGYIDNLERGGSDYTATLLGNALNAKEIQIWSDIDGVHNNDPRFVRHTSSIPYLTYDEASELAYFGAKVLHPTCILPAQAKNIPVILKNTMTPEAKGTIISNKTIHSKIKAIAAKDNITSINIKSGRMLNAYGFLKRIFEIFEKYKTSVDMVTTSEVGVSVTIDDCSQLENITKELTSFSNIEVTRNQSIVCIVGNFISEKTGIIPHITNALSNIPICMISFGGSKHNISLLINQNDKEVALNLLHYNILSKENILYNEQAYA